MQVLSPIFDFAPYRRIPHVTALTTLALGRALLEARPAERSDQIEQAAKMVSDQLAAVEAALERHDHAPPHYDDGPGFEGGTEALWEVLRGRLSAWQGFEHPGLDALIERGDGLGRVLEDGRRKATRARACAEALFARAGLRVFRGPYDDQSGAMGVMLRLIDDGDFDAEIEELVGVEILPALAGCQVRYRDMVAQRHREASAADPSSLALLRQQLRRSLELYAVTVLALLAAGSEEAAQTVRAALRPIVVLRAQMAEGRWLPGEEEPALCDDLDEDAELASVLEDSSVAMAI